MARPRRFKRQVFRTSLRLEAVLRSVFGNRPIARPIRGLIAGCAVLALSGLGLIAGLYLMGPREGQLWWFAAIAAVSLGMAGILGAPLVLGGLRFHEIRKTARRFRVMEARRRDGVPEFKRRLYWQVALLIGLPLSLVGIAGIVLLAMADKKYFPNFSTPTSRGPAD